MSKDAEAPPAPKPKVDAYATFAKAARRTAGEEFEIIITVIHIHDLLRLITKIATGNECVLSDVD